MSIAISPDVLSELYHEQGLTQEAIAKMFDTSQATIYRLMKRFNIHARPRTLALRKYPRYDFDGTDADKAYIIGFRLGDLYVRRPPGKKAIQVACNTTVDAQIRLFKTLFGKYGHIAINGFKDPTGGEAKQLTAYLNESFEFLLPGDKIIPDWILTDDSLFMNFWAGYTDAEGSIGHGIYQCRGRPTARHWAWWGTTDEIIIRQARQRLHDLGYHPSNVWHCQRKGQVWSFAIGAREPLLRFLTAILPLLRHADRRTQAIKTLEFVKEHYIPPDASGKYPCPYCDFVGTSPSSLQVHLSRWCQYKPTPTSEQ